MDDREMQLDEQMAAVSFYEDPAFFLDDIIDAVGPAIFILDALESQCHELQYCSHELVFLLQQSNF